MSTLPGIDVLIAQHGRLLRGRKVALLAHAASVGRDLTPAWQMLDAAGADLVSILAPEHGLWAEAQDMEAVSSATIRVGDRQIPVHSLYGSDVESLSPRADQLGSAEVLVIDLQDVGSRYYTFSATADLAVSACMAMGIEVIVTDRPNPIGCELHEGGAGIDEPLRSFVGHFDVPQRHGLTLGELVLSSAGGDAEALTVIRAEGLTRSTDAFAELAWVVPSPNMPTIATALVYPGGCLLEGTNLSEGRGTTCPFETFGAPWLDADRLVGAVSALDLPGVTLRALRFRPMFHKYAAETCAGAFVHVDDPAAFRPLRTYLTILWAARALCPEHFALRTETYEFRSDVPALDLLWGSAELRELLDAGAPVEAILELPEQAEKRWNAMVEDLRIYR